MHLLFTSPFSQLFRGKLGEEWNSDMGLIDMMIEANNRSRDPFFKISMIAGRSSLWNRRNKLFLNGFQEIWILVTPFFKESVEIIRQGREPSLREGMQDYTIICNLFICFEL